MAGLPEGLLLHLRKQRLALPEVRGLHQQEQQEVLGVDRCLAGVPVPPVEARQRLRHIRPGAQEAKLLRGVLKAGLRQALPPQADCPEVEDLLENVVLAQEVSVDFRAAEAVAEVHRSQVEQQERVRQEAVDRSS
jgi:hypothetical protein